MDLDQRFLIFSPSFKIMHPNASTDRIQAMTTNEQLEASKPWYRQRWLWFVMSVPIASVILSSIMVTVAVNGKDSLVKDNYYKYGMEINQTIEQDQLADSLGLQPKLTIENGLASLEFQTTDMPQQAFVTLNILHPTVAEKDIIVKLLPSTDGVFRAEVPELEGRRYIDVYAFDESWRIREELHLPLQGHALNQD